VGYRDALKQARTQLDQEREALRERESTLAPEDEHELPEGLRARLTELRGQLTPAGDTMDAIRAAEAALEKYRRALTESIDLSAQIRGAMARGESRLGHVPGRARRAWGRVGLVFALVAILVWLPGWLVESAGEAAADCLIEHDLEGEPVGDDCGQGLWLWPAAAFVWEREAAIEKMHEIEARAFARDVERAASAQPNRAERDAMAAAILARDAWEPGKRVQNVFRMGAFEVLADSELASVGPEGFLAARATADIERANVLAVDSKAPELIHFDVRRGAWLCLYGDATKGREILVRALAEREAPSEIKADLAAAAFACSAGQVDDDVGAYLSYERRRGIAILDPSWQADRRRTIARGWMKETDSKSGVYRLMPVALMLQYGELSLHEALALLPPAAGEGVIASAILFPDVEALFTRWSPLGAAEVPMSVEALTGAADRLVEMVAAAKANPMMRDAAVGSGGPVESARGKLEEGSDEALDVAAWTTRANPEATMLRAAWAMRLQAAMELARRNAHEEVLALLKRADEVAPARFTWLSAGLRHAAGDAKGAVAQLDAFASGDEYAELPPADRAMLGLELALARATVGGGDAAALDVAREVFELVSEEDLESQLAAGEPRWLFAALALRAGSEPPKALDAAWASAVSDEHARSVFRSATTSYWAGGLATVAVAEPYALGHTTGEGGDVEVWLNRLMHRAFELDARTGLRASMWARAEAAAWREDAEAEKLWRERVTRLEAKIVDGRTVVLAHHAGL